MEFKRSAHYNIEELWLIFWCTALLSCSAPYSAAGDISSDMTPLAGSSIWWPRIPQSMDYVYGGNEELARLLDVGSCIDPTDSNISYVPPLDGTAPQNTLCLDAYAMNFVLFDLQLVNLKSVDALNGFFTVQLQLVLHWMDAIGPSKYGDHVDPSNHNCTILCDTSSTNSLCCDQIWVPPLHIPGCSLNRVQSIMDTPSVYYAPTLNETIMSFDDCSQQENLSDYCFWRRIWYLNIDATCAVEMNFHKFPFDIQTLTINVFNPYASRTWFQLTKGFLRRNVEDRIIGVNLSPELKISGWYINDLIVSSNCGSGDTWQNTFITQDELLADFSMNAAYASQKKDITEALDSDTLKCAEIENLDDIGGDDGAFANPANWQPYVNVKKKYAERVKATLKSYEECMASKGVEYRLNLTERRPIIPGINNVFVLEEGNLNRSFGLLNLLDQHHPTKVSFPCAIRAVANLTTPGIRITILIHRVRIFYLLKLILPTIACVAFSFSAFGIQPHDIVGRLTVVVPSAIALTALQGLVVATDVPPTAYLAPTTYIFIISYAAQLLMAVESLVVYWVETCKMQMKEKNPLKGPPTSARRRMNETPHFKHLSHQILPTSPGEVEMSSNIEEDSNEINRPDSTHPSTNIGHQVVQNSRGCCKTSTIVDCCFMALFVLGYTGAIVFCLVIPFIQENNMLKKEIRGISMWK